MLSQMEEHSVKSMVVHLVLRGAVNGMDVQFATKRKITARKTASVEIKYLFIKN